MRFVQQHSPMVGMVLCENRTADWVMIARRHEHRRATPASASGGRPARVAPPARLCCKPGSSGCGRGQDAARSDSSGSCSRPSGAVLTTYGGGDGRQRAGTMRRGRVHGAARPQVRSLRKRPSHVVALWQLIPAAAPLTRAFRGVPRSDWAGDSCARWSSRPDATL